MTVADFRLESEPRHPERNARREGTPNNPWHVEGDGSSNCNLVLFWRTISNLPPPCICHFPNSFSLSPFRLFILIFAFRHTLPLKIFKMQSTLSAACLSEPILSPNDARFVMFPLKYHDMWKMYKQVRCLVLCLSMF